MRFSELYTREQFAEAAVLSWWRASDWRSSAIGEDRAAYEAAVQADQRDRKTLDDHKANAFGPAMKTWLEHLRAAGRLNEISGLAGRETLIPHAWNAFVDGTAADWQSKILIQTFAGFLTFAIVRVDDQRFARKREEDYVPGTHPLPSDEAIDAAYNALVAAIEAGDTTDFGFRIDDIQDSKTGDSLKLQLTGWTATLLKRGEDYHFYPAEDANEIPIQSVEIDLPTGELLLSDWIRVPGFREATELGHDDRSLSINNDQGAVNTTKAHAERHGFAHVQTTNTYVGVHQDSDGRLMICENWDERDEDYATAEGMTRVGAFSCDLWWITAIDRQVLLNLMAAGGCETPEETLDSYLTSNDAYAQNVSCIQVTPGRWRIHFGPDFASRADRSALGIPQGPQPWLVMEPIGD